MRLLYCLLLLLWPRLLRATDYDVTRYGALPDGQTVNTRAINEAVRAAHQAGGGRVVVPAGVFVSGTVRLLSNVELYLSPGAVLRGSPNLADYVVNGAKHGLLFAFEARHVAITGQGTVDGNSDRFFNANQSHYGKMGLGFERKYTRQGEGYMPPNRQFQDGPIAYDDRPGMLCVLVRCEQVVLRDVRFINSPEWTFRIGDCDGVLVDGIHIQTDLRVPNADGIHTTTSRNVRIANCYVSSGDDSIVVTGFGWETFAEDKHYDPTNTPYTRRTVGNRTGRAEHVVVSNCLLQSRSAGVRIGYGNNSIRNCLFENLVIFDSNRGIGVFARDPGDIEHVSFRHVRIETRLHDGHWWGKAEPIHVSAIPQKAGVPAGRVRHIQFSDVTAQSQAGAVLWAEADNPLEDIRFDNVALMLAGGPLSADWGGNVDLRPSAPPDRQLFKHDVPALFARHVVGLTLNDLRVHWARSGLPPYFTHGVALEDCRDVRLTAYRGTGASGAYKPLQTTRVQTLVVRP